MIITLKPKQRKCIELMILGTMMQAEIAKELKVSEQTICSWKKNGEFAQELANANRMAISALVPRAINKTAALLSAESEQVQLAAAKEILDRAGYTTPKGEVDTTQLDKLDELLKEVRANAQKETENEIHD